MADRPDEETRTRKREMYGHYEREPLAFLLGQL